MGEGDSLNVAAAGSFVLYRLAGLYGHPEHSELREFEELGGGLDGVLGGVYDLVSLRRQAAHFA